ncbi:MAG: 2-amino-4-hydroxy-6-hydroxymethyldihydropteridine diphosphokinase [Desulfobacterales bacterium]|jgi:2-amino-4-hydroxy-6-hydroxymethyldihydropteridine diphosphokinase
MSPTAPQTVIISVGSNLGDKIAHCRFGIARVAAHEAIELKATSPFYRTAPVDYTAQDWFVNAAFRIETTLSPRALLAVTNAAQVACGQGEKEIRFGPRTLDLDLIFYGELVMQTDDLELPHPRMHKRRFVLQPICDIDPQFVHPVLRCRVDVLLGRLQDDQQEVARIDA